MREGDGRGGECVRLFKGRMMVFDGCVEQSDEACRCGVDVAGEWGR